MRVGDLVRVKDRWAWVYERFEGKIGLIVEIIETNAIGEMVKVDFGHHSFYFNYDTVEVVCE